MDSQKNTEVVRGNTKTLPRHRNFVFTSYDINEPIFDETKMKYLAYAKEICPTTGREHWQSYVCWKNAITFDNCRKKLAPHHVEIMHGTLKQNNTYCSKQGILIEHGSIPDQGKRTDLNKIKDEILNGNLTVDEICTEDPEVYHQYGRTLEKLEDLKYRNIYDRNMPEVTWIYGETGTGKSHIAFQNFDPTTHFVWTNDNGWWDGYKQQEVVILNDFRGEIPYNNLLKLCDKWPEKVRRRNREPIYFTSNKIIITSSLPPEKVYKHREEEDSLAQLLRRINLVNLGKKNNTEENSTPLFDEENTEQEDAPASSSSIKPPAARDQNGIDFL